jgi:transposase-like protein
MLLSQGHLVAQVIKSLEISEVTYYRWRKEYGGMNTSQAKRFKELEKENTRLRRAVSNLTLES